MQRHRNAGFTLLEMLMVMMIVAVMTSIVTTQYRDYLNRVGPERAARLIGSYVSLTRAYAIQRRTPVSLVLDSTEHKMWIRSATDTIKSLELGDDTDFRIETLTMGFPGDSMSFSSRGVCRECGLTGTGSITVAGSLEGYLVTFNALGIWKMVRQ
jgi:prepilin-type N-terminal cleavage/methylation domain-containing protein